MDSRESCLDPTDLSVLVARLRVHAAETEARAAGGDGSDAPFSCRFKGIDTVLRQEVDLALMFQTPFGAPAAGRMRRLKGVAKGMLRRIWSWQSTYNAASVGATVALCDKTTALVVEVENMERRIRELEARLDGTQGGSSNSEPVAR